MTVAADGLSDEEFAAIENPTPSHPPEDANWLSRFELTERSGKTVTSERSAGAALRGELFLQHLSQHLHSAESEAEGIAG